ncbi:hypothetical protein BDB01DRAFT_723109 [Pilobolus umbonatus]|nr:hypothetical protein BDB01DRAFT_723109 [Pilobolus umbonatus]
MACSTLFNIMNHVKLSDLDHAIRTRQADKSWSLFITLTSRENESIPLSLCCSLYALLSFAKSLATSVETTDFRQHQLNQLVDYMQVTYKDYTPTSFLSSVEPIHVPTYKSLLKAIHTHQTDTAWRLFYRMHEECTSYEGTITRNTCLKLMVLLLKDKNLNENQIKGRLELVALHGAGHSTFDDEHRYLSASDLPRLAHICFQYEKSKRKARRLIDEFVKGIMLKKQKHRADVLDELIWTILSNDDITKANNVLNTVQSVYEDKVTLNESVYVNLINAYRRQKDYHSALKVFEKLLESKQLPTVKSLNAVLQIFAAQGLVERADYIYDSMVRLAIQPDEATYTEMIRVNGRGGTLKQCLHYYHKMMEDQLEPNVYTYSALIDAASRRKDIKSVVHWFQIMVHNNIQPNKVIVTSVLKSLSRKHSWRPDSYQEMIDQTSQALMIGIKPDAILYTVLLQLQTQLYGIAGALDVHKDMISQMLEPNTHTYTTLISACSQKNLPELAQSIFNLMQQSIKHRPNTVTYTALIRAWSRANNQEKVDSLISQFLKECKSDGTGRLWIDSLLCEQLRRNCCSIE